jgi:hypothetical protein
MPTRTFVNAAAGLNGAHRHRRQLLAQKQMGRMFAKPRTSCDRPCGTGLSSTRDTLKHDNRHLQLLR